MKKEKSILIVEDEALAIMTMEDILRQWGYTICRSAATGKEAIKRVKNDQPGVVLMDIGLVGEIDGIEAARQIRAVSQADIIFLTGYSDRDLEKRAEELNPIAYLVKPIDFNQLETILSLALDK